MRIWVSVLVAAAVIAPTAAAAIPAAAAAGRLARPVLEVGGEVSSPTAYTAAQLAALPQTTVTLTLGRRQVTDTGVLLETLVADAAPAYPASLLNIKNELLRVTVAVRSAGGDGVTFAAGELDPGFGNHPALLALTQDGRPIPRGPELVVPGDRSPVRSVAQVSAVTVGIATWVAAVGDDNYVATVTPAEQFAGGRALLLSLAENGTALPQPRLVTDGDVKGGRYVSGIVDIYVGAGPAR